MMKRKLLPRAVLALVLLVVVPAAADAPQDQYERFDGDSVTIKDTFTKLEWDRKAVFKSTQDLATFNCGQLASLQMTGRLPTVKELLTILDEEPHQEYEFGKLVPKMIDALAFADTPVDVPYWSSTPAPGTDMFWTVSFMTGLMTAQPKTAQGNARCVR